MKNNGWILITVLATALTGCGENNKGASKTATPKKTDVLLSEGIGSAVPTTIPSATNRTVVKAEATAAIQLGHVIESADLTPTHTNGDGECFPTNLDGVECYQLVRKENRPAAFLYLKIAPHLKDPPFESAMIIVDYIDRTPHKPTAALTIEYDALNGTYTRLKESVPLTGSNTWKQASFTLLDPLFKGRQNHGADFRLCVLAPDLYVRSVTLLKNPTEALNDTSER